MQALPHKYSVSAHTDGDSVNLSAGGLPTIESAAPAEFGGPGDLWSPETLLTAAVADCFILTFKAIANASRFDWQSLSCDVTATLARVDKITRFTELNISPKLTIADKANEEKAIKLLQKAESGCLVTNSLSAQVKFVAAVQSENTGI